MIKQQMSLRQPIILALIFLASFTLVSCSYARMKDDETQKYEISEFSQLYIKGNFNVHLVQSDDESLSVDGFKETLETIEVDQGKRSGELRLSRDKFSLNSPQVTLHFKDLTKLRIEGGAKITTEGYLDLRELEVRVEGGANVKLKLKVDHLKLRGEGGVVYQLQGRGQSMQAALTGAAYIKAGDFVTDSSQVRIEGVGIADLNVNSFLKASVEGMGSVTYVGEPKVEQSIQGLGKISKK